MDIDPHYVTLLQLGSVPALAAAAVALITTRNHDGYTESDDNIYAVTGYYLLYTSLIRPHAVVCVCKLMCYLQINITDECFLSETYIIRYSPAGVVITVACVGIMIEFMMNVLHFLNIRQIHRRIHVFLVIVSWTFCLANGIINFVPSVIELYVII